MGVGKTYRHVHQTQPEKQTTKTNTIQTTHMKIKTSILTLLAAALSAGASWGQLPVSPTSGIIRTSLTASATNLVAVPFPRSVPFEGTVASVSGLTINLSGVTLVANALTNHSIYIATDVDPGDATGAYGRVLRITGNGTSSVDVELAVTPEAGDEFQIFEQFTLETLIGTGAQSAVQILTSSSSSLSDTVYVESGGTFTGYWHHVNVGWKAVVGNALTPNVQVPFGKGLLIVRRGGAARTLTVQGEALTGRFLSRTTASPANNVVNNPFLVEVPLIEAGLGVTSNASLSLSDSVYLENSGLLVGYWRKNNGNWYPVTDTSGTGTPITTAVTIRPGKALLAIDRNPNGISFPQPFAE